MIGNHKEGFKANLMLRCLEVLRFYAKRTNHYLKYILAVQCDSGREGEAICLFLEKMLKK